MTMHLVRGLSTTGKKSGRSKFRNSSQAQQSRQLKENWNNLLDKWGATPSKSKKKEFKPLTSVPRVPIDRDTSHIPSRETSRAVPLKQEAPKYTGTACIGIAQTHKSNMVPVFSSEQAVDISKMRR